MKKILAAILFFGSVGTAMAQITPGGWQLPLYGAGILNPDMPRQVCKYRKEKRLMQKSPRDFNCETPSRNGPTQVPNPSPSVVSDLRDFESDHNNDVEMTVLESNALDGLVFPVGTGRTRLTGPGSGGMGCSIFGTIAEREPAKLEAARAACNGVKMIAVRTNGMSESNRLFASVISFWAALFGNAAPAGMPNGPTRAAQFGSANSVQGCFFSEKYEEKDVDVPYDCVTVAPSCEMTQMKIFSAEMMIKEMQLQVDHIQNMATSQYFSQEMKDRMLQAAQMRLADARKQLALVVRECDRDQCELGGGPAIDGATSDAPFTCTRKQVNKCYSDNKCNGGKCCMSPINHGVGVCSRSGVCPA